MQETFYRGSLLFILVRLFTTRMTFVVPKLKNRIY